MKFVIYLRVSTDQQVLSGLGIEGQRQICLSYVSKFSPCSVLEYLDDGFSGALELEKRPALLTAISVLEKDDVLLISKRDRIGRDPIINAMIERAVERKKAKLISASGDVNDSSDPSSILMRRMVDAFAEYERLIIGARTKVALQVKKKKNERVGYVPYGYKLCTDNIHIEQDENEQEVLTKIREGREFGLSFREIAKDFNEMSLFNRTGKPWNHVAIRRVMK